MVDISLRLQMHWHIDGHFRRWLGLHVALDADDVCAGAYVAFSGERFV